MTPQPSTSPLAGQYYPVSGKMVAMPARTGIELLPIFRTDAQWAVLATLTEVDGGSVSDALAPGPRPESTPAGWSVTLSDIKPCRLPVVHRGVT